jgi:thioredoxin 1
MIEMVLEDIEAEQPELKIVKVDSDRFRSIAKNYSVVNLPVLIIFSNGKVVKQQSGFMRREELLAFISE